MGETNNLMKLKKWTEEYCPNILFLLILLIALVGLGLSVYYFGEKAYKETSANLPEKSMDAYIAEQRLIVEALNNLDEMNPHDEASRDSIVEIVRCSQLMLLRQQEILVDDVRQEMNNHINKMNTWLAYALSLMAVLGVFLPLALQYHIQQQDQKRFEELLKEQNIEFEKQKESFDKLKDSFNKQIELSELAAHYNAFYIGIDTDVLAQHDNREHLYRTIWNETLRSFSKLVENTFNHNDSRYNSRVDQELHPRTRILVVEGLIKIKGMLTKMMNHRGATRHREIWNFDNEIHKLIVKIDCAPDTSQSYSEIHRDLKNLLRKLHDLNVHLPLSR